MQIIKKILTIFYLYLSHFGFRYKCPFCGFHAKDMFPIGIDNDTIKKYHIIGAGRRNAGCYKCGSMDRERLIWLFLIKELCITEKLNQNILHIAPERPISDKLRSIGFDSYICGDLHAEGYEKHYPDYVQNVDVMNLKFVDESFDLIICNHVLEHVSDDAIALQNLFRVLRHGGRAILQVPISWNIKKTIEDPSIKNPVERERLFGQKDHIRIYGKDYIHRLEHVGFRVDQINLHDKFSKAGLNPKEILFICKKDT